MYNAFSFNGRRGLGCARHGRMLGCLSKRDRDKKSLIKGRRNKSVCVTVSIHQPELPVLMIRRSYRDAQYI